MTKALRRPLAPLVAALALAACGDSGGGSRAIDDGAPLCARVARVQLERARSSVQNGCARSPAAA